MGSNSLFCVHYRSFAKVKREEAAGDFLGIKSRIRVTGDGGSNAIAALAKSLWRPSFDIARYS